VQATLGFFFLMFVFRVGFRNSWLAALGFVAFWSFAAAYGSHHYWIVIPTVVAIYAIAAFVVLRFGFIALAVGTFTATYWAAFPSPLIFPVGTLEALSSSCFW